MNRQLRDLAEIYYGKSPAGYRVEHSEVPIYATSGQVGFASEPLFGGPLIVVARKGTLDNPTFSREPCWVIDTAYAVVPRSDVDAKWLFYALSNHNLSALNEATGVPSISRDYLYRVELDKPDLDEQRKIAHILTTVDDLIDRTEALIAKLRAIKQGLMHDLLTRGVDEHGQLRPPREEAPELYKESAVGWVPREWELAPLRSRRHPEKPHIKTEPFGTSLKTEHWTTEGIPVITIGALGEGDFIESQLLFVSETKAATLEQYKVESGDLVFSRVADVGRSVLVSEQEAGWIMSSNLMRISLDQAQVVPGHLYLNLVYNPWTRNQIRQSVNAGGREIANTKILDKLLFAWPSEDEQMQIVEGAKTYDSALQAEYTSLAKLCEIKTGLMQDLLTGKVRVTVD